MFPLPFTLHSYFCFRRLIPDENSRFLVVFKGWPIFKCSLPCYIPKRIIWLNFNCNYVFTSLVFGSSLTVYLTEGITNYCIRILTNMFAPSLLKICKVTNRLKYLYHSGWICLLLARNVTRIESNWIAEKWYI